jgi:ribosomal-protein-alanine N-acetyltransferase
MRDLERQSPSAAHWSGQQYEGLVAATSVPQRSERFAWVVDDESVAAEILAFLVAHRVDAEWELENIVVAETSRRRGVGTLLLGELVIHARSERGSGIFLEVRESNQSARALYRKMGFEEAGLRKSYYVSPPEDAILCRLRLY